MLPKGTVTFLFTDIEGSTGLWEKKPEEMSRALLWHDTLISQIISNHGGQVFKTVGDAFCSVFSSADSALNAAVHIQTGLREQHTGQLPLRVRIGLHAGTAEQRAADYFGPTVNRVARIMSAGHGGQILASSSVRELADGTTNLTFRDLGKQKLKGIDHGVRIYQVGTDELEDSFPELQSLESRTSNLPVQMTSFIGRRTQLEEMTEVLQSARLLTVAGPGGIGKTRTSIELASTVLDRFPDGIWFADLTNVSAGSAYNTALCLATAMGVRADISAPTQTLLQILRDLRSLIILDNCEHVIEGSSELASSLLAQCPKLSILCTSRQPLRVAGEFTYHLAPLETPVQLTTSAEDEALLELDAVRLFFERARQYSRTFALSKQTVRDIARICQLLDGLPLAIELAAARVESLGTAGILRKLQDRLSLLSRRNTGAPVRQQTLRSLIDWSYDLLSDAEKSLFARLAVFRSSFSLDAFEVVCASSTELPVSDTPAWLRFYRKLEGLPLPEGERGSKFHPDPDGTAGVEVEDGAFVVLEQLVEKSLVRMSYREERPRYDMLGTIRAYAEDKLAEHPEREAVERRHASYFLLLAEEGETKLYGHEPGPWRKWLSVEQENLKLAFQRTVNSQRDNLIAARIATSVSFSTLLSETVAERIYEAGKLFRQILDNANTIDDSFVRVRLFIVRAVSQFLKGDLPGGDEFEREALQLARDCDSPAMEALINLWTIAFPNLDPNIRIARAESILSVFDTRNAPVIVAFVRRNLGTMAIYSNDLDEAERQFKEALRISRDPAARASAHLSMSWVLCRKEDQEGVRDHCKRGIALHAQSFNPDLVVLHTELLRALYQLSEFEEMKESVAYLRSLGPMSNPLITQVIHEALALWSLHEGNHREALAHFREAITCSYSLPNEPVEPLVRVAELIFERGRGEEAALIGLCARSYVETAKVGLPPIPTTLAVLDRTLDRWKEAADEDEQALLRDRAAAMSWDEAVQMTLGIIDQEIETQVSPPSPPADTTR